MKTLSKSRIANNISLQLCFGHLPWINTYNRFSCFQSKGSIKMVQQTRDNNGQYKQYQRMAGPFVLFSSFLIGLFSYVCTLQCSQPYSYQTALVLHKHLKTIHTVTLKISRIDRKTINRQHSELEPTAYPILYISNSGDIVKPLYTLTYAILGTGNGHR